MDEFKVTIDQFEGPLDLMLHLIKEKQLDLENLDMNVLTDRYIAYLNSMTRMHLEIAGEYLSELAQLIEYKSKKMLGIKEEIETEEPDTKEKLVQRLLEYQKYKEVSEQLNEYYESRSLLIGKPMSKEADAWMESDDEQAVNGSAYDLYKAMQKILRRMQIQTPKMRSYEVKEISIEDRELEVRTMIEKLPETFRFESLLQDCKDSVQKAIATFISVLDLARLHILVFTVDEQENIWFSKGGSKDE